MVTLFSQLFVLGPNQRVANLKNCLDSNATFTNKFLNSSHNFLRLRNISSYVLVCLACSLKIDRCTMCVSFLLTAVCCLPSPTTQPIVHFMFGARSEDSWHAAQNARVQSADNKQETMYVYSHTLARSTHTLYHRRFSASRVSPLSHVPNTFCWMCDRQKQCSK